MVLYRCGVSIRSQDGRQRDFDTLLHSKGFLEGVPQTPKDPP